MDLLHFIRFGYALVIGTFLLMAWVSTIGAREVDLNRYPPCHFNPLCSCSKSVPDLGIVRCQDIHLPRIPETVNVSKVFMLHLENNGLRTIDPYFLQSTGYGEGYGDSAKSVWTSGNSLSKPHSRNFSWMSDGSLIPRDELFWARGQPDDLNTTGNYDEQCVHISYWFSTSNTDPPGLNDVNCNFKYDFICERREKCRNESTFAASKYEVRSQKVNYFDAVLSCKQSGKDLVSVETLDEWQEIVRFLKNSGLYKIVISRNPLPLIPDEAFLGLERSLWELDLSHNHLTQIPNRALRYLQKLRLLDLRGNDISKITPENWRGLESSLMTLILSDNSITMLPTDSFSGLPMLETIDLRGNNLKDVDPSVFRDGMGKLANLILADNQLSAIPYQAISYLKNLKTLDLSRNRINRMSPAAEVGVQNVDYNFKINLGTIRLDYNQIPGLEPAAFQYFNVLNRTYLDGNPLESIQENAFRQAKIRELYIRKCGLKEVSPAAFVSLENSLEILDLSGNNIQTVPEGLFHRLEVLRTLSLRDNTLSKIQAMEVFNGFQFTLFKLDLSGSDNAPLAVQDLRRLRNLRALSLSRLSQASLSPDDFQEFGVDLEELEITLAGLQKIKNNAFKHVHGLKHLRLQDNYISSIETQAFEDIGHSLLTLKLSHALSMQTLPADAMRSLTNLEELDLSNNKIKNMPDTSFHFLRNLKRLYLHDNVVELVHKGTFQGDIHHNLNEIYLSFNGIRLLQQHAFVDLPQLEQLHLDDNKIDSLERRTFMNLENLKRLNLRGNTLATVSYEAFQNLPELEDLDLAYNRLRTFDFSMFDQVGNLAMLHVNLSHNDLLNLVVNPSMGFQTELGTSGIHSNIKVLDLSHNNISLISPHFFRPAELSLTRLHLSHNRMLNATKDVFGNMPHLQVLDVSHNFMYELDFDTFRNTKRLQVLSASNNRIVDIPNDLFRFLSNLRIVDFSHNRLRNLPDNLFREEGLERLDVSHNLLGKLPLTSMSVASAVTLCELDLSWNSISSLAHGGLLSRFKRLSWLDLSYNRLAQIDAGTFKGMPRLSSLDLGHNSQLALEVNGLSFQGLEYSLLELNLDNVSLPHVPTLPTHRLISLSLAFNFLPTIPPEMAGNISSLQRVNLNNNDLTAVPIVTHSLTELRYLSMAGNPITSLTNTSLLGVADHLKELDLRDTDLTTLETGAFCKMVSLQTLKMSLWKNVKNFNLPRVLQWSHGLKNLEVYVEKDVESVDSEMRGEYPSKLDNFTFSGKGLKKLDPHIFQGIRAPSLHLCLRNTSVTKLTSDIFQNMGWAKNISIDARDNLALKNLQNPSTGSKPGLFKSTFLTELRLTGSKWSCDCELGWVEVWQRKKRQYLCGSSPSATPSFTDPDYTCRHTEEDLRTTLCANKNNNSLIEVLKNDIECGWSSATPLRSLAWSSMLAAILHKFLM